MAFSESAPHSTKEERELERDGGDEDFQAPDMGNHAYLALTPPPFQGSSDMHATVADLYSLLRHPQDHLGHHPPRMSS